MSQYNKIDGLIENDEVRLDNSNINQDENNLNDCVNYEETQSGRSPQQLLLQNSDKYSLPVRSSFVELQFKGNHREIVNNPREMCFSLGQCLLVETETGLDIGEVTALGPLSEKKAINCDCDTIRIVRPANEFELKRVKSNRAEEPKIVIQARKYVEKYELDMKITESDWQFDKQKLTIYFTAPHRIDFRDLVKDLAREFKTRIELRQISAREETKRLGFDVGPCGNPLCCTSFLDKFEHITLDHARAQRLSNNISKLSGNCGRLKCCLRFEYDAYVEELQKYPPLYSTVTTDTGTAVLSKVDIFRELVTLFYKSDSRYEKITAEELQALIAAGKVTERHYHPQEEFNDFSDDDASEEQLKSLEDSPEELSSTSTAKDRKADKEKTAKDRHRNNGDSPKNKPYNQRNNASRNDRTAKSK